jgi:hypothetical protein
MQEIANKTNMHKYMKEENNSKVNQNKNMAYLKTK